VLSATVLSATVLSATVLSATVLSATVLSASERRRPLEILNKVGGIKAWKEY